MWILKNSKDLLHNLKSRSFSQVSSIKTFDFSTLYTTLPHDKVKTRLKETIHKAFSHRNYGSKFVVLGYNSTYFSNKIQKGKTCYSEEQVISLLEFLIDNIFVSFGRTLFQQQKMYLSAQLLVFSKVTSVTKRNKTTCILLGVK